MLFSHSPQLLDQFPQLSVATLSITGVTADPRYRRHDPAVPGVGQGSAGSLNGVSPARRRLLSSGPSVWIKGACRESGQGGRTHERPVEGRVTGRPSVGRPTAKDTHRCGADRVSSVLVGDWGGSGEPITGQTGSSAPVRGHMS